MFSAARASLFLSFLPMLPVADALGFEPLPWTFLAILVGLALSYLALVELGKAYFYRRWKRPGAEASSRPRS